MALRSFTKPRFLLCEGDDDKGVFEALIQRRKLPEFQICHSAECNAEGTGGNSGFVKSLRGMEPLSGFRSLRALLIISDNDVLDESFAAVQTALTRNGYAAPANATAVGNMAGKPVVIRMIPRSDIVGDLETLCLPGIYERWPKAEECTRVFLECTGANVWKRRASVSKAKVRAASVGFNEVDPYKGIGHLFRNGTLSVDHHCFDEIAEFLRTFDAMCGL